MADDQNDPEGITGLSVQLFTVPSVSQWLVHEHDALSKLLGLLVGKLKEARGPDGLLDCESTTGVLAVRSTFPFGVETDSFLGSVSQLPFCICTTFSGRACLVIAHPHRASHTTRAPLDALSQSTPCLQFIRPRIRKLSLCSLYLQISDTSWSVFAHLAQTYKCCQFS